MPTVETGSNFIAWWGAGLSTLLAVVKLAELWRDRFRVEVSYAFNSLPEDGNRVMIRNLTGRPLILTYWELQYGTGAWPRRKYEPLQSPDHDHGDVRIDPHSTRTLTFAYGDHFDWGVKALRGRSIWVRLYIAGRRPFLRRLYP